MCTVSIIALNASSGAYRIVTNRDEQRSRAPGEPPEWRSVGGVRAIAPRDPVAGGTWIATTERGLTLCLLNGNLEPAPLPPVHARSRGEIIGMLLGLGSTDAIIDATGHIDLAPYPPFRLVCVEPASGGSRVADMFWDARMPVWTRAHVLPACFVSSGLGDSRVAPRLSLFADVLSRAARPETQDAFHRHVWPERPEISVCMARDDARTVSITAISVEPSPTGRAGISVEYHPVACHTGEPLASESHFG